MKMELIFPALLTSMCLILTNGQMGPFELELRSFDACPASKAGKNLVIFKSRQEKLSRKKYNLFVDAYMGLLITDGLLGSLNVAKKTPQGWKDNFFQLDVGGVCGALKKFVPGAISDLSKGMNTKKRDCPFPLGNFTNISVRPNIDVKAIPAFFYNVFRLRLIATNQSTVVGCIDAIIETFPKKS